MQAALELLLHPTELTSAIRMLFLKSSAAKRPITGGAEWVWAYGVLNKVSRSFAFVIQELPPSLRDPVSTMAACMW